MRSPNLAIEHRFFSYLPENLDVNLQLLHKSCHVQKTRKDMALLT